MDCFKYFRVAGDVKGLWYADDSGVNGIGALECGLIIEDLVYVE